MKNVGLVKFIKDHEQKAGIEFIEDAATNSEIKKIAKLRGIDLENGKNDFAFFKNIYALTDKANANKCIVPKDKIEPVIKSIVLKPINIDHIRSYTVGVYLDAYIEDDTIYSYGAIFKGNFEDEWEEAKGLFEKGKLATSFEIWCPKDKRTYNEDGTFSLDAPIIAGGAILFRTKPAFKEAQVLEMAKKNIEHSRKNKVVDIDYLVAASVNDDDILDARYELWDNDVIGKMVNEMNCPECNEKWWSVSMIDYENSTAEAICDNCGLKAGFHLEPSMKVLSSEESYTVVDSKRLTYKERQELPDSDFALVKKVGNEKIRMFVVRDVEHVKNALARLGQEKVKENLTKMEVSTEEVLKKILKKAKQFNMTEILDKYKSNEEEEKMEEKIKELETELAKLKEELAQAQAKITEADESIKAKDEEIKNLNDAQAQLSEEAKKQLEDAKKEIEAQVEQAKKDAKIVAERKVELADFAKDLKEEDLLNDDKYEIAKLKKEKAELEAKVAAKKDEEPVKKEEASVRGKEGENVVTAAEKSAQKVRELFLERANYNK